MECLSCPVTELYKSFMNKSIKTKAQSCLLILSQSDDAHHAETRLSCSSAVFSNKECHSQRKTIFGYDMKLDTVLF